MPKLRELIKKAQKQVKAEERIPPDQMPIRLPPPPRKGPPKQLPPGGIPTVTNPDYIMGDEGIGGYLNYGQLKDFANAPKPDNSAGQKNMSDLLKQQGQTFGNFLTYPEPEQAPAPTPAPTPAPPGGGGGGGGGDITIPPEDGSEPPYDDIGFPPIRFPPGIGLPGDNDFTIPPGKRPPVQVPPGGIPGGNPGAGLPGSGIPPVDFPPGFIPPGFTPPGLPPGFTPPGFSEPGIGGLPPVDPGMTPMVIVYGPDGTQYSSPAAAMKAGVMDYSMTPPGGGSQFPPMMPPMDREPPSMGIAPPRMGIAPPEMGIAPPEMGIAPPPGFESRPLPMPAPPMDRPMPMPMPMPEPMPIAPPQIIQPPMDMAPPPMAPQPMPMPPMAPPEITPPGIGGLDYDALTKQLQKEMEMPKGVNEDIVMRDLMKNMVPTEMGTNAGAISSLPGMNLPVPRRATGMETLVSPNVQSSRTRRQPRNRAEYEEMKRDGTLFG